MNDYWEKVKLMLSSETATTAPILSKSFENLVFLCVFFSNLEKVREFGTAKSKKNKQSHFQLPLEFFFFFLHSCFVIDTIYFYVRFWSFPFSRQCVAVRNMILGAINQWFMGHPVQQTHWNIHNGSAEILRLLSSHARAIGWSTTSVF